MGNHQKRIEITDEETGETFGLNIGMLVSDIRDALMSKRRDQIMATTWKNLSEEQQQDEIVHLTNLAEDLVAAVVDMVASAGREVIHAKLDNFKIKDGMITVTSKGSADDGALLALNSVGTKNLKIIVANAEQFDVQREDMTPDPDQPSMLDGESDQMSDQEIDDLGAEMDADADAMDDADDLHEDDEQEDAPGGDDPEPTAPATDEKVAGYQARMDAKHQAENPYLEGNGGGTPEQFQDWDDGWMQANGTDHAPILTDPEQKEEPVPEVEDDGSEMEPSEEAPDAAGDQAPYQAGQQARLKDAGPDDNPHDGGTPEHEKWAEGYTDADGEVKQLIEEGRKAGANGEPKKSCPWKRNSDGARLWLQGWEAGKGD